MENYIFKKLPKIFVSYDSEIDPKVWEGRIGTTFQDFQDGKWVKLSEEQFKFHEDHPSASVEEVLNMELKYKPETLEENLDTKKAHKIHELYIHDSSDKVNEFTINGNIKAWFTVQERTNYKNSLDSAKLLGVDTLQFFVGDQALTINTDKAEKLLAMIQIYADTCFIQTKKHENAIKALGTIEEVEVYDFTTGYPDKLSFTI